MTKYNKNAGRLWSYWREDFNDYKCIWQVVPKVLRNPGKDYNCIKLIHYTSLHSGYHDEVQQIGETLFFPKRHMRNDTITWKPLLKKDVDLEVLSMMED